MRGILSFKSGTLKENAGYFALSSSTGNKRGFGRLTVTSRG